MDTILLTTSVHIEISFRRVLDPVPIAEDADYVVCSARHSGRFGGFHADLIELVAATEHVATRAVQWHDHVIVARLSGRLHHPEDLEGLAFSQCIAGGDGNNGGSVGYLLLQRREIGVDQVLRPAAPGNVAGRRNDGDQTGDD